MPARDYRRWWPEIENASRHLQISGGRLPAPRHANDLVGSGRGQPGMARQGVDTLRVCQRGLLQAQLMVPLLEGSPFCLELLDLVTKTHALEVLPGKQENKGKNHRGQPQKDVAIAASLGIDLAAQARIIDSLYGVENRKARAPGNRLVSRPSSRPR